MREPPRLVKTPQAIRAQGLQGLVLFVARVLLWQMLEKAKNHLTRPVGALWLGARQPGYNKRGCSTPGVACVSAKWCAFCIFARFCTFSALLCVFVPQNWPAGKRNIAHNRAKMCKKRFFAIPPFACHRSGACRIFAGVLSEIGRELSDMLPSHDMKRAEGLAGLCRKAAGICCWKSSETLRRQFFGGPLSAGPFLHMLKRNGNLRGPMSSKPLTKSRKIQRV